MVNTYDVLLIFKPIVDVDTSDASVKTVETLIGTLKGKIVKHEKLGRKRLAYEIKKFKDGFLSTLIVELPAEAIEPFKRSCKLNEDILRMVIVSRDPNQVDLPMTPPRPPRGERPDRRPGGPGGRPGFDRPGFDRNDRERSDRPPRPATAS